MFTIIFFFEASSSCLFGGGFCHRNPCTTPALKNFLISILNLVNIFPHWIQTFLQISSQGRGALYCPLLKLDPHWHSLNVNFPLVDQSRVGPKLNHFPLCPSPPPPPNAFMDDKQKAKSQVFAFQGKTECNSLKTLQG